VVEFFKGVPTEELGRAGGRRMWNLAGGCDVPPSSSRLLCTMSLSISAFLLLRPFLMVWLGGLVLLLGFGMVA